MHSPMRRPSTASVSFTFLALSLSSLSTAPALAEPLPEIVVTATRSPTAISDVGSSISVISADTIARQAPGGNVADALRTVPGLDVTTNGGPGSVTTVRIRGAESRNTLVLIDGIRVNDPSSTDGTFDFASLVPTDIERIEVLRGPQSALYGSDAAGGVINVITRKGKGAPRATLSAEGGSYGTKSLKAGVSGSSGPVSYAFSLSGFDTDGFSQYGYRIRRIERQFPWGLEKDGASRFGASGRVSVTLSDSTELEFGGYAALNRADTDSGWGMFPDTPSRSRQDLLDGYIRLKNLMFDGRLTNRLTLSGNTTERKYRSVDYSWYGYGDPQRTWSNSQYRGNRLAAEYQGDLKLDRFGTFTLGAKTEREAMVTHWQDVEPYPMPRAKTGDYDQTTNSVYALHQISPLANLHLSLGGRIDAVEDGRQFNTWRGTVAYDIEPTATTLRASVGTGGKAPGLYQLHDPMYGNPDLRPETSVGFDAGIDQRLFDDRVTLSATYFGNRFRNMIDFTFDPATCPPTSPYGCYLNVTRARSHGVELSGSLDVVPDLLRLSATYTYLHAINADTGEQLARRPRHEGRVGLTITPLQRLTVEPSVVLVGERYSSTGEQDRLAPYARFDMRAEYRIDDTFTVYVRGENLTNARYEDVRDYGTPGRSVYGGIRATW